MLTGEVLPWTTDKDGHRSLSPGIWAVLSVAFGSRTYQATLIRNYPHCLSFVGKNKSFWGWGGKCFKSLLSVAELTKLALPQICSVMFKLNNPSDVFQLKVCIPEFKLSHFCIYFKWVLSGFLIKTVLLQSFKSVFCPVW